MKAHIVEYWDCRVTWVDEEGPYSAGTSVPMSGFEGTDLEKDQVRTARAALDQLVESFPDAHWFAVNRMPSRCSAHEFGLT
jgi:hypothetical protein